MIKTAIKHFIYEACIYQFFKGINKNFSQSPKLVVGKTYSKISYKAWYKRNCRTLTNIKILNIYPSEIFNKNYCVNLSFKNAGRTIEGVIYLNSIYNIEK